MDMQDVLDNLSDCVQCALKESRLDAASNIMHGAATVIDHSQLNKSGLSDQLIVIRQWIWQAEDAAKQFAIFQKYGV